ncbi:hypothetical protein CLV49_1432 [Labedella gwakjiensis]|uniref:Uncharacterized protein n=2 Tax=Labedella gwakjiensis TaxID=390269 RepID=A0A2P8GV47_9MICO|nr:hypothetical protein [Labedella gwakjiensis]PSL37825.1 hypothetical protein CLV49_1432 [Labedella gwakjiensis]
MNRREWGPDMGRKEDGDDMVSAELLDTVDIDERMFSGGPMIRGHVEVITTIESHRSIRVWCDCEIGEDHAFRRPGSR